MAERTYFEGHSKAVLAVSAMNEAELLAQIDGLYGRDRLQSGYTMDELRAEAIRQTHRDWLNPQSDHYQTMLKILEGVRYD